MKSFLDRLNAHNNAQLDQASEPASEPKVESKPKPKVEIKPRPKFKPKPKEERKAKPKPKVEIKPRPKPEPKVEEPKPEVKTDIRVFEKKVPMKQETKPEPAKEARKPIANPKVSIVMQSYLGDYPGSRTNPVAKIKRVIASFLNQTYNNSELIIVSDGCDITHKLWMEQIRGISRIKYAYVDKPEGLNMYESSNGERVYRGTPRAVGVTLASGDIITYCDTDDFLMAYFCEMIVAQHKSNPESDWMFNTSWFDHKNAIEAYGKNAGTLMPYDNARLIKVPNIDNNIFIETRVKEGMVVNTPWLLSHLSHCNIKWMDSYGNISEDILFSRKLREQYPKGHVYSSPTYIRCHYINLWDV